MKSNRLITLALAATLCTAGFTSCGDDYDDTAIKGQIEDLDQRVSTLEEKVKTDIAGIQAAIATLQGNDYVKAVKEIEGGYEITFSKGTVATIKNGKDGVNGKDGKTPVLTAAKDVDGMFYWKVDGEWLMDGDSKVSASRTPEFTAETDPTDSKTYWKIDGEWLLNNGQKVQATADAEPVKFDAKVSDDKSTITFTFDNGDETVSEYVVNVAKGELTIAGKDEFIVGEAATYTVALPEGWSADDLDVVRADAASTGATGVAITRAGTPAWAVTAVKAGGDGATITVTGTDIPAGEVAELTVTFVKADGERLVGSKFLTAWVKETSPATVTISSGGEVATAIAGYSDAHALYTAITVSGSTAMNSNDWDALKAYAPLETLTIDNTATSAVMPANAFENHPALKTVTLTGSTFAAIPASAFAGCAELTTFTGIAAITEIGASAFEGCAKLATVNTVTGVTTIGENAFKGCAAMTSATLTAATSIGEGAFAGTGLTAVTFPADVTTIGANAFDGSPVAEVTFSVAISDFTGFDETAFAGITGKTKTLNFAKNQENVGTVYSNTEWKGITWTKVTVNSEEQTAPAGPDA